MFWILVVFASDLPEQVHLSATENPGRLVFSWSTRNHFESQVKVFTFDETFKIYNGSIRLFEMGQNKWKIHFVTVSLLAGSLYKYQVGSSLGFSKVLTVKVPKNQESSEMLFLGDFSFHDAGKITWKAVEDRVLKGSVEGVVALGDLAYNLHSKSGRNGDIFMNKVQDVASFVPFMVSPGNHEAFDGYYNFLTRFDMPGKKFFYSFTQGFVRFVGINTEFFLDGGERLEEMMEFLRGCLDRNYYDFKHFPWLVVFGHRPVYCQKKFKIKACRDQTKVFKEYLLEMFRIFQVDLFVNAHVHNYQRSLPLVEGVYLNVEEGEFRSASTVFVTNGAAGAEKKNTDIDLDGFEEWMEFGSDENSFGILNANETHLEWKQINSLSNEEIDSFRIRKDCKSYLE
jgi:hypothetical protein